MGIYNRWIAGASMIFASGVLIVGACQQQPKPGSSLPTPHASSFPPIASATPLDLRAIHSRDYVISNTYAPVTAPDGRIWWQHNLVGEMPGTSEEIRETISREFRKAEPVLPRLRPILFEPSGRVWFLSVPPENKTLFGYDGKEFIERKLLEVGGLGVSDLAVAWADNVSFFAVGKTVLSYDGTKWSDVEITPQQRLAGSIVAIATIMAEADGKGVVASYGSQPSMRWRKGAWSNLDITLVAGAASSGFAVIPTAMVEATTNGVWLRRSNLLEFLPYRNTAQLSVSASLSDSVEQLKSEDSTIRDNAMQVLLSRGQEALPLVQAALEKNPDEPLRYRLEYVLSRISSVNGRGRGAPAGVNVPPRPAAPAISFRVTDPVFELWLPHRGLLVGARSFESNTSVKTLPISNRGQLSSATAPAVGGGVWLIPPDEQIVQVCDGRLLAEIADSPGLVNKDEFLLTPDGKDLWITPHRSMTPFLLNLETFQITKRESEPLPGAPVAILKDGSFLVQGRHGLIVHNSLRPDPREVLEPVAAMPTLAAIAYFTGDGCIWTDMGYSAGQLMLCRFNGTNLDFIHMSAPPFSHSVSHSVGEHAILLGETPQDPFFMVAKDGGISEPSLRALIERHSDAIAREYGRSTGNLRLSNGAAVETDSSGRIWYLEQGKLNVFSGQRWFDAMPDLLLNNLSRVGSIAVVGNGSKVFVSPTNVGPHVSACLASFDGAKFTVEPTEAYSGVARTQEWPVREADGALWAINYTLIRPEGPLPTIKTSSGEVKFVDARKSAQKSLRLTESGVTEQIDDAMPLMVDSAGHLWIERQSVDQIEVYYKGARAPVDSLEDSTTLFAGPKGKIYGWGDMGLREYIPEKSGSIKYVLARTFKPQIPRVNRWVGFSRQLNALCVSGSDEAGRAVVNIFRIPG